MPELELHIEHEGQTDPRSQRVGIQAACLAVLLAVVTIASHRAHTQAVVMKMEANDHWAFFQSKKIKSHVMELGIDLLGSLTGKDAVKVTGLQDKYKRDVARYAHETEETQKKAQERGEESELAERKALRYDVGEGLLEMGLVLASMFFIAKRNIFPIMSMIAGMAGTALAASALFLRH